MTLIYGFMLINDYQGRTRPSYWSNEFMDSTTSKSYYKVLLSCYVPDFMIDIFRGLSDTSDPRRPGLEYFTTLAASIFEYDFGRLIPPQLFLYAHNMSCESDTSRNPSAAITELLSWNIFHDAPRNRDIEAGRYFSAGTSDGTFYSFMFSTLDLLFSPVTGKSILRRSNIQAIPCFNMTIDPTQQDEDYISNPYTMFLNASSDNVYHMMKFMSEFSAFVKQDLKAGHQLGAIPDVTSGIAILNHGYSIYGLPTWHNADFSAEKIFIPITDVKYAAKIKYLQPAPFTVGATIPNPSDPKGMLERLYLRLLNSTSHHKRDEPSSDKLVTFDSDIHVRPNCLWLLPYEEGDGPIGYAMITGSIIESFEIDGASIPMPNPLEKLSDNNSNYGQGAIPMSHVIKGYGTPDDVIVSPLPRAKLRVLLQQVSVDLYDLAQNRIGYVDAEVEDAAVPANLPGFSPVEHIRGFKYIYSKISYRFGTPPPIEKRRLALWSPYRTIHIESNKAPRPQDVYMFSNFRTMYGTHIPLYGTEAPSQIIPSS